MHGLFFGSIALALTTSAAPAATMAAQAQPAVDFDIRGGSLAEALNSFARQAQVQLLYPYDVAAARRVAPLRGRLTRRAALERLLARQPLVIVSESAETIALREKPERKGDTEFQTGDDAGLSASDIIVTAQRRRQRQQSVPIAVSAFGQRAIVDYRLETLRDVSRVTPGLLVSSFSPARPIVAIRGATNTFNQIGVDKPVGVLVDDVFIPRNSAATFELFGVHSIEVLRGPQGTLFGRNVTGGAIVIDTGRPAFGDTALSLRSTLGSYRNVQVDALADVAVSESVAARVAGTVRRHDGWGRDRLTGQELDDLQSANLRGQLRMRMGEDVELLLGGDYAADASGGRTLSSIGVGDDGNRRTSEAGVPQRFDRALGGASARLFWTSAIGTLSSITALRQSRSTDVFANVGTNWRLLSGTQSQALSDDRDDVRTLSQELRLASPEWRLGSFVVGAYFSDEDATRALRSTALAARTGALVTDQRADQAVRARSAALFADGTINLGPALAVTLGGRYTWDRKRASLTRTDYRAPAASFAARGLETSWSEFTPRAVVQLKPTADAMLYASYSRGYTAGGYNTEAATLAALRQPFQPETVDNFEAGLKSEWLDRRLRVNVTGFHMKYRDKQELYFNNLTRVLNITNAARARVRGFEAEIAARPLGWMTLSGNYGYLDSRYEDFVIPGGAVNTGNRLGSTPEHKASAILDLDVPVAGGRLFANSIYSYTSGYYTGAAKDPGLYVPGYDLVQASLGYASPGDSFRVTLFARNLFDTEYLLIPSTQVVRAQLLGEPRTLGVSLATRF